MSWNILRLSRPRHPHLRPPHLLGSGLPTSFHPFLHPLPPCPALPPHLHRRPRPLVSVYYRLHQTSTPHQATPEAGAAGGGAIFDPRNYVHWGILLVMATGVGIDCYFRFNKQAEELIKANTLLWEEIKEYDKKRDQEAKEAKEGGEMSEGVFREKLLSEIKRIADSVNPPLSAAPSPPQV